MTQQKIDRVRAVMRRPGVSAVLIAGIARVSRNQFSGWSEEGWKPTPRILSKMVAAANKIERLLPPEPGDAAPSRQGG